MRVEGATITKQNFKQNINIESGEVSEDVGMDVWIEEFVEECEGDDENANSPTVVDFENDVTVENFFKHFTSIHSFESTCTTEQLIAIWQKRNKNVHFECA